jgi:hypothetical protein
MVHTIPLVCLIVPSSPLREAGPVSLSLQQSLQQQCGSPRFSPTIDVVTPGSSLPAAPEDNNHENRRPATPIFYKHPFFEDIVGTIKSHMGKDR